MALKQCPECSGQMSDKAIICPHCGFPIRDGSISTREPRKARKRRPNGSGTVVRLSGRRRNPFQVRVNTHLDANGYPVYDVLDSFPDRVSAEIALAEYNKDPYDPSSRKKTFADAFAAWYQWKYKAPHTAPGKKTSAQYCTLAAYRKCLALHQVAMWDLRAQDMQDVLDQAGLSHAMLEHVRNLFRQLYGYCMQHELVAKDYSRYTRITKEDDDEHGVPFTREELLQLWEHRELPFVDTVLIYCLSGFRINELARMPLENVDLEGRTFTGGLKNRYSRNRIVPIHPDTYGMVRARMVQGCKSLIYHDGTRDISESRYRECFREALRACGIQTVHTPHDCRHTFNVLLDGAGVDRVTRYQLMGHKGQDINETVYAHKDLGQLRAAVESIRIRP